MMYRLVFIVKLFFCGAMAFFAVTRFWSYGGSLIGKTTSWPVGKKRGVGESLGGALRYFRKIGTGNRRVHAQRGQPRKPG
jgi:hypothetical protein